MSPSCASGPAGPSFSRVPGSGRIRWLLLPTIGAALSWTAACAEPDSGAEALQVTEIASPAGPGSGAPYLETTEDGVLLAWTEPSAEEGVHRIATAAWDGAAWSPPAPVVERDSLFVNWADFPTLKRAPDGTLFIHWLVRFPRGGTAYRVQVARSEDGGAVWSEPWTPHEDGTATEHGFLSFVGMPDGGMGMAWLDGRKYAEVEGGSDGHGPPEAEMTLRFRSTGPTGHGPETLLDARTCDCCQTTAVETPHGPVVAYRDRSADEIRDIAVVRWGEAGWSDPLVVHDDGWEIPGCPVNGPAMGATGERLALAWFTGAGGTPRVKVAFSDDAGQTWGPPVQVDDGNPEGRVDLLADGRGGAWVAWLERTAGAAEVRLKHVDAAGQVGASVTVAASSEARASGFPRMAAHPGGGVLVAWTDPSADRVRVARVDGAP